MLAVTLNIYGGIGYMTLAMLPFVGYCFSSLLLNDMYNTK